MRFQRTVFLTSAFRLSTSSIRVTFKTRLALADGAEAASQTLGIGAAGDSRAKIAAKYVRAADNSRRID